MANDLKGLYTKEHILFGEEDNILCPMQKKATKKRIDIYLLEFKTGYFLQNYSLLFSQQKHYHQKRVILAFYKNSDVKISFPSQSVDNSIASYFFI